MNERREKHRTESFTLKQKILDLETKLRNTEQAFVQASEGSKAGYQHRIAELTQQLETAKKNYFELRTESENIITEVVMNMKNLQAEIIQKDALIQEKDNHIQALHTEGLGLVKRIHDKEYEIEEIRNRSR